MAKRKVGSQIGNLTPDHGKSRIDPIYLRAGVVQHVVGKLSTRATTLLQSSLRSEVCTRNYGPVKSRESQPWQFGSPRTKSHFDVGLAERHKVYYMGEGGGFPRIHAVVSLVSSRSHVARPNTKGAPTLC
jgi:hypothetical protein